jgi:hypothetical protein
MTFSTNYTANETKDVAYLEAGIHEDVRLISTVAQRSPNGNNFIEFKFQDSTGAMLTHTEWEPNIRPGEDQFTFQTKVENLMRRILQIVRIYTAENFEAKSFEEIANWIADKLKDTKDIPLRIKAIYNWSETKKRDYVQLPKYWKYTFIEKMSVPKTQTKIRQLQIDKFERTYTPDTETSTPNQFEQPNTSVVGDLPF